jgi:hypothetical protein
MEEGVTEVDDDVFLAPEVARAPGVLERPLEGRLPGAAMTFPLLDGAQEAPGVGQAAVVGQLQEARECTINQPAHLGEVHVRIGHDPDPDERDARAPLGSLVMRGAPGSMMC